LIGTLTVVFIVMLLKQFNNNIVAGTNLKVAIPVIAM